MTLLAVTYPDAERATVDVLNAALTGEGITVSVGVPTTWTPASAAHIQVMLDGTLTNDHPVIARATIRLVVRAATTTEAKRIAQLAHGLLCAHDGTGPVSAYQPLTGLLPARDPQTDAEIASVTVRALVRSTPIT